MGLIIITSLRSMKWTFTWTSYELLQSAPDKFVTGQELALELD